jgi:hypothetical protein
MPTAEKLLDLLVRLYADQEGVKINYSIEEGKENRNGSNVSVRSAW